MVIKGVSPKLNNQNDGKHAFSVFFEYYMIV